MDSTITTQLYLLFVFIICGIVIGTFFDLFRALRKSFKTPNYMTYIEDVLFWLLSGLFFIIILFKFNNGQIRNYVIIGLLLGIILYMLFISKYFIRIIVLIIKTIKKVLYYPIYLIITVIKEINRTIFKSSRFVVINIKNILKLHYSTKNNKNL